MKSIIGAIKPYLRWFILGATVFFLVKTFKDNLKEVADINLDPQAWLFLTIALIVTLLAHVWSGWVWSWILNLFNQSLGWLRGIQVYLITNIAKYLPGNVWHFYGRISAIKEHGGTTGVATLCTVLEPLLMAAAALLIAVVSTLLGIVDATNTLVILGQSLTLVAVLVGIHPAILNPLLQRLSKSKTKTETTAALKTYPLVPFIGELGFILLRGTGFLLVMLALQTVALAQVPNLLSAFSIAWLLGLVIPGAPGGIGVFEATAIALLPAALFAPANVLLAVACYRVISILAEAIAALLAWSMQLIGQSNHA